jgi:hypothetical protein
MNGGNIKMPESNDSVLRGKKKFKSFGRYRREKKRHLGLRWASGEKKNRQWMIKEFYPRILFTFSDVVVYVTRNFR